MNMKERVGLNIRKGLIFQPISIVVLFSILLITNMIYFSQVSQL